MPVEQWHLSKSVPITFIFAIVLQTVAIVWFFADLSGSVETNSRDIIRHDTRIETLESAVQDQAISLARMSENIQAIRDIIETIAQQE